MARWKVRSSRAPESQRNDGGCRGRRSWRRSRSRGAELEGLVMGEGEINDGALGAVLGEGDGGERVDGAGHGDCSGGRGRSGQGGSGGEREASGRGETRGARGVALIPSGRRRRGWSDGDELLFGRGREQEKTTEGKMGWAWLGQRPAGTRPGEGEGCPLFIFLL